MTHIYFFQMYDMKILTIYFLLQFHLKHKTYNILSCKAPKKQTTKLLLQNFCIMLKNQRLEGKHTAGPDEMAHYEPSLLDLQNLQNSAIVMFGALWYFI